MKSIKELLKDYYRDKYLQNIRGIKAMEKNFLVDDRWICLRMIRSLEGINVYTFRYGYPEDD